MALTRTRQVSPEMSSTGRSFEIILSVAFSTHSLMRVAAAPASARSAASRLVSVGPSRRAQGGERRRAPSLGLLDPVEAVEVEAGHAHRGILHGRCERFEELVGLVAPALAREGALRLRAVSGGAWRTVPLLPSDS